MRFYQAKGIPAEGMAEPWGNHLEVQSSVRLLKGQDKGFPDSSVGKESARNAGDLGSIPGFGRSLGWDDPSETGKATHSSILAWRIP